MYKVNPDHMPEIIDCTEQAGKLTGKAAALGLVEGIPVFGGGNATFVNIGTGCIRPGDTHIYVGTSGWVSTYLDHQTVDINAMITGVLSAKKGYGYKDHVKADAKSKFITNYSVTNAAVNDNQEFVGLLKENDGLLYGDCGYVGKKFVEQFPEGVTSMIHEKAEKNHPLTEAQKASNREKSRIRCRIEHIFGYMTGAMHGITVRSIGLERAKFNITGK